MHNQFETNPDNMADGTHPEQSQPEKAVKMMTGLQLFYGLLLLMLLIGLTILAFSTVEWFKNSETETQTTRSTPALQTKIPQQALDRGDRLVVGVNDSFRQLNPLFASGDGEYDVVSLIFESLFISSPDGTFSPVLAESWHFNPSDQMLTVTLRSDHTFRDGRVVSAQDVLYTYQCLLSPFYDGPLKGRLTDLLSIEAGGDNRTVTFRFSKQMTRPAWSYLTIGIMKSDYYPFSPDQVFELRNTPLIPEGSGSFQLVDWTSNHANLSLRNGYAGIIKNIEIRQVASEAKYRLIQEGQLDIVRNVWDDRMKQRAQSISGYTLHTIETSPESYLLINPNPQAQNMIQTADQRLELLLLLSGQTPDGHQLSSLTALSNSPLPLYYFKGLDSNVLQENRRQVEDIMNKMNLAGLTVQPIPVDWPELAERATRNQYELLLLPATTNSRLPEQAILLSEPISPDASAMIMQHKSEVFITCDRLIQLTINPHRFPFAASVGTWACRVENIGLIDPPDND